ncbi:T9SS type A sorting domain-containing protein [Epilithonimonas xixisoli]|uniref:Putative secreted protein (Por secretion system target) n=1 Tax=Epilithonimonas xixisoli TaxID=1476462 RepID=A0A4R8IHI6_9FLAO|nr:T9SS type A sorting domain-containing protein [Epilithonimonas xixisoli]TDX86325.1 putative secreted protein (Por secretion system target) [Epilithonimonas xixisoli]
MIKQLFFAMSLLLASFVCHAQTISLTGAQFNNWEDDVDLTSTTGIIYTAANVSLIPGEIKFRENHSWGNSWGANSFPVGIGVLNVQANILVNVAGTYNVVFNKLTGVYAFVLTSFPRVSLVGNNIGTPWETDVFLNTIDGITYNLQNYNLVSGEVKFRLEAGWLVSWGSSNGAFPTGLGVLGGLNINANVAGTYNISFNLLTGVYLFTQTLAVSDTTKKQVVLNTLVKDDLRFSEQVNRVDLYSADGKLIKSYQNITTVNMSDLSKGQYVLKIQIKGNETFSQKIIKN